MKVVFMGTPDFAVETLKAIYEAGHEVILAVSQPDKPKGRSGKLQPTPVKEFAMEHDIPVFQPVKIRAEEAVEELRKYEADVFVVAAFGQILPKVILDMPRLGCVNVHGSLLPKYRGAAPIQWAVINGEKVSGNTTMLMGPGLDDGDMLLKSEIELVADETGGSLFDRLAIDGGKLAVKTIEALDRGEITPVPQDESQATHVGMISKDMGNIDWTKPAIEIERLIRGLNPWPSAFSFIDGKQMKFWKANVVEKSGEPGTIIDVNKNVFTVACGAGALEVEELQLEGKKRMAAGDFLRGYQLEAGKRFVNGRD
ncbi:methionyl-tRNA formyltransferase [Pseudobutyrivibrio xylanivorans]|uniref:Methionyl-tRNA formyltransferase n=1 Tax=Pseudobutyrivibrio xylanivorans TaxID=185007 RepID=A0A5P6VMM6_PSEXY|nr:methionyl-tRNA formyltransferase [Pseudobutyrivibrio xylanivorans]QFJ53662.1 methionyl-tRNA formyltransferase [Pseudobutyrivibrio xylanivorans]